MGDRDLRKGSPDYVLVDSLPRDLRVQDFKGLEFLSTKKFKETFWLMYDSDRRN